MTATITLLEREALREWCEDPTLADASHSRVPQLVLATLKALESAERRIERIRVSGKYLINPWQQDDEWAGWIDTTDGQPDFEDFVAALQGLDEPAGGEPT